VKWNKFRKLGLIRGSRRSFTRKTLAIPRLTRASLNTPRSPFPPRASLTSIRQPIVAAKRLGMKADEYQKHLQDLAKQPQGMSLLPFKDQQEIVNELMQAKLIRAIYSEHQLSEQLEDFWFNHFNVFIYKDLDRWYMIPYERDSIRPHVLGKFRDLLEANAKSPAMLFYLDNSSSADPHAFDRLKLHPISVHSGVKLPPLGPKRGLN